MHNDPREQIGDWQDRSLEQFLQIRLAALSPLHPTGLHRLKKRGRIQEGSSEEGSGLKRQERLYIFRSWSVREVELETIKE